MNYQRTTNYQQSFQNYEENERMLEAMTYQMYYPSQAAPHFPTNHVLSSASGKENLEPPRHSSLDENKCGHPTSLACLLQCTTWLLDILDIADEHNPKLLLSMVSLYA